MDKHTVNIAKDIGVIRMTRILPCRKLTFNNYRKEFPRKEPFTLTKNKRTNKQAKTWLNSGFRI